MKKKLNQHLIDRLKKKASQSLSQYKISCMALDSKGEVLGFTVNSFRKDNIEPAFGSGLHAEAFCLAKYGHLDVKNLVIMRVGRTGDILPIDPCEKCQKLAEKMGVKIYSVMPGIGPKKSS